jgi:hypothetical protein
MSAPQCVQRTAAGRQCRNRAMAGSDRCSSHLRRPGPQPILTDELVRQLAGLVEHGIPVETACVTAGIGKSTYYRWWDRGDPAGGDPHDEPFRRFRMQMETARAKGQATLVVIVRNEANRDPTTARWLLERGWPEQWARPLQREQAAELTEVPAVDRSDPFGELDELAARRRRTD